jgi:hypothetical protein
MNKYLLLTLLLLLFGNVYGQTEMMDDPQKIIDKAIDSYGGKAYQKLNISFVFRNKEYTIKLDNGLYEYIRMFSDSTGSYRDILNNDGFTRIHNEGLIEISSEKAKRISNSINSVAYFTLLPKGLNDPATIKKLIGQSTIKNQEYYHIEVKFKEDGGGDDHDDIFAYWVNTETFTIDYLAYSFHVNGGGVRFREAIDPTKIGGIRFQNYINYKPVSRNTQLGSLPQLFNNGELKKLSEIINEEIKSINL